MKVAQLYQVVRNMGLRYTLFRVSYEFRKKTGLLAKSFPANPPARNLITLSGWRKLPAVWAFPQQEQLAGICPEELHIQANRILAGEVPFFSSFDHGFGKIDHWTRHPETGYQYPDHHWTAIPDFNPQIGDIKYVWERSRFAHHLVVMRADKASGTDHSKWVFSEIDSWIAANPINRGPNWRCSQEISIRLVNWWFLLQAYKHSSHLTEERWQRYQHAIYWQLHHVFHNIHFSRIAVRNNHAITELAVLFLSRWLFPFIPEAVRWSEKAKGWLEEEIGYQLYEDGTYLQYSMTYQRVVVEVLCLIKAVQKNAGFTLNPVVDDRALQALKFLRTCQDEQSGWLPNYGANDGALFFPLATTAYRDFRPQLNALSVLLTGKQAYSSGGPWQEEVLWWGMPSQLPVAEQPSDGWHSFPVGGFYILRHQGTLTFLRCGNHPNRPSQADNLHLDLWAKGNNVLFDSGSYKYNTSEENIRYFAGTAGHNTVMVGSEDQMLKGPRFIWLHWTQARGARVWETDDGYHFEGTIKAFGQVGGHICQARRVSKHKGSAEWTVADVFSGLPAGHEPLRQIWHPHPGMLEVQPLTSGALNKNTEGWYSEVYGSRVKCPVVEISVEGKEVATKLTLRS